MDHATLVNAPKTIESGGGIYRVSALTLKEWGPIQSWIKQNVPGPMRLMSSADLAGLNEADRRLALAAALTAQQNWPPRIGSTEWFRALDHDGGHAEFLYVSLSKHQPGFTREDATNLSDKLDVGDAMPLVYACLGLEAPETDGPKA